MSSSELTVRAELFPGWWSGFLVRFLNVLYRPRIQTSYDNYQSSTCCHGAKLPPLPLL